MGSKRTRAASQPAATDNNSAPPAEPETAEIMTRPGEPLEAVADKLRADAEAEASGEPEGDAEPKRKKRGRPRGSRTRKRAASEPSEPETPEQTPEQIAAEIQQIAQGLAPVVQGLMSGYINRAFPEQPYTEQEALQLAGAVGAVGRKYAGTLLGKYREEIALASVAFMQVSMRRSAKREAQRIAPAAPHDNGAPPA